MHKFRNITTKIIGVALATTLAIGGVTVMAASGGNITCGTNRVNIGKTNDTISTDYIFVPEHTGTYHLESSDIVLTGGYGTIDPMVRIGTGTTYSSANEICRIDGGVVGTLDFSGDVELVEGQTYTFRVSSHFNPNLRPTGNFNFTITDVTPEDEDEDVAPDYGMPDVAPEGENEIDVDEDVAPDYGMPDVAPEGENEIDVDEDVAPDYGMPDVAPEGENEIDVDEDVAPDYGMPDVAPEGENEIDVDEDVAPDYGMPDVAPEGENEIDVDEDVAPDYGMPEIVVESEESLVTETPSIDPVSSDSAVTAASSSSVVAAPVAAPAPATQVAGATRNGVERFVDRLYEDALNRNADATGRLYWINLLNTKAKSGTEVANGFLHSVEFISRDLDNAEFVNTLYTVFFDRKPDGEGFRNWMIALENGATRSEVISGFTSSEEWNSMCAQFGINA